MRIILFRHGPAGHADPARWPDDGARPLTPKGIVRTRAAARGLRRLERGVVAILTSPLVRAEETARLAAEAIPEARFVVTPALVPGATPRRVLEALAPFDPDDTILLVGHEPDLGRLAATWTIGTGSLPLRKAGACAIDFEAKPATGAGELQWLIAPRVLRRLGRKKAHA